MVEIHKGFEGFESLRPKKDGRKEEDVNLSGHLDKVNLLNTSSDLARAEVFYDDVLLKFTKDVFNKVRNGREASIKGEEILGWTQEFCDFFQNSIDPSDLIRLAFERDDYRENYIYTHSVNVCLLTARIAIAMNFFRKKLQELVISALFHDIGMMRVPENLWNKPGRLSPEEYEEVQKHAIYGEEIFRNIGGMGDIIPVIIGQHHERMDGTGYPRHLTKDAIHYGARLISLVDRYEGQTHTRLWRPRFLPDKAIQMILDNEGRCFDPHFIKVLLKVISIFPVGTWVRISSGGVGSVIKTNETTPMRPILNMQFDRDGNRLDKNRILDLSKQLLIHVEACIDPEGLELRG